MTKPRVRCKLPRVTSAHHVLIKACILYLPDLDTFRCRWRFLGPQDPLQQREVSLGNTACQFPFCSSVLLLSAVDAFGFVQVLVDRLLQEPQAACRADA